MQLRFSRYFGAVLGLTLLVGFGVALQAQGTPVASADGFGRTDVTFTKWFTSPPNMAGTVGGDVGNGSLTAEILGAEPHAGGKIVKLTGLHHIKGSVHSADVLLTAWMFDNNFGIITGGVTGGWRQGASVYGTFKVIQCSQAADGICFQGNYYIVGGNP
jgi:hypothetical protein